MCSMHSCTLVAHFELDNRDESSEGQTKGRVWPSHLDTFIRFTSTLGARAVDVFENNTRINVGVSLTSDTIRDVASALILIFL